MSSEQFIADRIHDLIYRAQPPAIGVSVLGPIAALDELGNWVGDDHQWAEGRAQNWVSLLDDLDTSWKSLPHTLKTFAALGDAAAVSALARARQRIVGDAKRAFDPTLRAALVTAERDLRAVLAKPAALGACWADLIRAVKNSDLEREQHALALLASLSELHGKPFRPLSRRLWLVLGDDLNEINAIRAELAGQPRPVPVLPPRPALEPAADRLSLAQQTLSLPAPSGDLIVWLAFVRAHVRSARVQVGPAVTLFEGRWLRSVLERWEDAAHAHEQIPAEVVAHRDTCLEAWETERPDADFALVRIVIGTGPIAAALDEARATAAALIRLAAFYDRGRSCWRDSGSYMVFVDNEPDWRTLGIADDHDDRGAALDLARDQTAVTLGDLAPTIGPHLPVTDSKVRTVLDLLRWLTEARRTWGPAALLLNDRVLENVAGWAGYSDARQFAVEQLALAWAFAQATSEIADAGIQAVYAIDRTGGVTESDPTRRAAFLEATGARGIVKQDGIAGDRAYLAKVINELAWLQQWQPAGTDPHLRLSALDAATASGPATARWLGQLQDDFGVLLDRAKRTRNAIVHGGPITESTLRTVERFSDEIASDALNQVLYARLSGELPRARFDQRQHRLEQTLDDLAQSQLTPAQGLIVESA